MTTPRIMPRPLTDAERGLLDDVMNRPTKPLIIDDFVDVGIARLAADAVAALPHWQRMCRAFPKPMSPAEITGYEDLALVTEEEWLKLPPEQRSGANEVAIRIPEVFKGSPDGFDREKQATLRDIFLFSVMTETFRSWLGRVADRDDFERVNIDFARYRPGDWAGAHGDLYNGTILTCLWYLDPSCDSASGGNLGYRNDQGEIFLVEPQFNRLAMIPILEGAVHWVEKRTAPTTGRYTIGFGVETSVP